MSTLPESRQRHNVIYRCDCLTKLFKLDSSSVDLIITSPPYAGKRRNSYESISAKNYIEWFLPISKQLKRVLKPRGSFILNIKERSINCERETYVIELILEMKKQGWLWTEEYIWHKKNSFPGKWPNRFRDSWERCLHFTRQKKFKMYQKSVMIPMGKWADSRLKNLSDTDKYRCESKVMSGLSKNVSNWKGKDVVYPTNVLHMATQCQNVNHSAAFPIALPEWFIKLFTKDEDVVLDPFMGSGTTAIATIKLNRKYIGMEKNPMYQAYANKRISAFKKEMKKTQKFKTGLKFSLTSS